MKKIAVLIDFTSVCETAIEHAVVIARKALSPLLLVHIAAESDVNREEEIKQRMKTHTTLLDKEGIPYLLKVGFGEFFSTIPVFINEIGADFVIVGTHGIRGISNVSYGLNILRLVDGMKKKMLIVQGHCEAPHEGYDNILVPIIGSNPPFNDGTELKQFAQMFHANITQLNFISSDAEVSKRETEAKGYFKEMDLETVFDYEIVSAYVRSYYKSILQYASIEDINLIVWSSAAFANNIDLEDKENLILNRSGIAVLHIPG